MMSMMCYIHFFCYLLYIRNCYSFNGIKRHSVQDISHYHINILRRHRTPVSQHHLHAISIQKTADSVEKKKLSFGLGKFAFSLLPLTPETVGRRKTLLTEIVKDSVWTLDQIQGIINVNVPVRGTVVRLSGGGLFVNNPVAPTEECIDLMRDLESKFGPVKFIVLSSLALEHKGTAGAFATHFPTSSIYVQPGQFSFPVNLPTNFFFPFGKNIRDIPSDSSQAPWYSDLDHAVLSVQPSPVGGFGETAFFHRASKTLLVTDTIVKVEDEPPAIIQEDPRSILYHSRDTMLEVVEDSVLNRRKGWRRMVLFGFVFQPAGIAVRNFREVFDSLKYVTKEMRRLGEGAIPFDGGLYLWDWVRDDKPYFRKLQDGLLVAPVLRKLLLNREPVKVSSWVDNVCQWPFKRIIPCHLSNNIKAGPSEFREAFDFLYENPTIASASTSSVQSLVSKSLSYLANLLPFFKVEADRGSRCPNPDAEDLALLDKASELLSNLGILKKPAPLLKRR